jgi:hypothetical protein
MYKIGLYEKEITPLFGNSLCGYFNTRLTDGVIDKTYAKSVVIEDDEKTVAVLAVDACWVSDELIDFVCKKVNKYTGIVRENITISATHSHTAGPGCVGEPGADDKLDGLYLDWLFNACADTIILAYQARESAKIKLAVGEVNGISFCRNYLLKSGIVRTNPGVGNPDIVEPYGKSDPYLPVLFFESENGKKLGLLYSFANHQDSVDGTKASGDWSSIVSYRMKDEFGMDFISVMVYGTAGNINQVDVNNKDKDYNPISCHKFLGNAVADGILKALKNTTDVDGKISVSFSTKIYENRVMTREEIAEQQAIFDSIPLPEDMKLDASSPKELFDACTARRALIHTKTEKKYYTVTFQIIKIGKVMIFALPGEVFSQFGFKIKDAFKDKVCVFDCLANNRWSYMPAEDCYLPFLYESLYGSAKYKAEDVTDIFDTFIELGKKM